MALSHESPTVPVDGSTPYSITPVAYTVPVHCVPWSPWRIRPSVPPRDAAHEITCPNACNGSSCVFMVMAHAHPTIRRAYTPSANAVQPNEPLAMRT